VSGELGSIREYYYWSERLIDKIAQDNGIDLQRRPYLLSAAFKILQVSRANPRQTLFRNEIAEKIRVAVGSLAVSDFVTPTQVNFATGAGRVDMGQFIAAGDRRDTAYMYTVVQASNGDRVAVCLFGSMHNYVDRIRDTEQRKAGWTSSSGPYIMKLIKSHGESNGYSDDPDDFEYVAVETVKAVLHQAMSGYDHLYDGLPETRGFTLGHADEVEWFAKIYSDIRVTKGSWNDNLADLGSPDRILIGAPVWTRTAMPERLKLYTREVREAGLRELEQRFQTRAEETAATRRVPSAPIPRLRVYRGTGASDRPKGP
jgi:hypothetical protein